MNGVQPFAFLWKNDVRFRGICEQTNAGISLTSQLPGFAQAPLSLPLSPSLGLPGFARNICSVIAQGSCIPEIPLGPLGREEFV